MYELVELGFISQAQYERARQYQRAKNCKIGIAMLELGYVTPRIMERFAEKILQNI